MLGILGIEIMLRLICNTLQRNTYVLLRNKRETSISTVNIDMLVSPSQISQTHTWARSAL